MEPRCIFLTVFKSCAASSEVAVSSESLDGVGVLLEWLIDIVRVGHVSGSLLLFTAEISLSKDLLSCNDVLLEHLGEEDVVDLNVMCRNSIVQEVWWEHHVVSIEPELDTVLGVESDIVSSVLESASGEDHSGGPEVAEKTWVVQRSISSAEESGSDWSHVSVDTED